jgi:cytochrome P450
MRFDPYDPELHQDPYPVYRRLREEFPVHYEQSRDFFVLSRHEDVLAALQDPELYCSGQGITVGLEISSAEDAATGGAEDATRAMPLLIMMDGSRHRALRSLVNRAFTPRRISELEPGIRKIACELLDDFCQDDRADLVRQFSAPLPTTVIAELLGIPTADRDFFKQKSTEVAQFDPAKPTGVHPASDHGPAVELANYLAQQFDERRAQPRDDLLSALLSAEIDGARLTPQELIGFAFVLLVAGNETTTNLISNAAVLLHRHPEQRRQLVRDPTRIPTAIEEFLRFDSPVQGLARTTTRDTEVRGVRIPKGKKVLLLFASANRDEAEFPEPERFDVERQPNHHLAFGFGNHFCLGSSLARLEARVAFEELLGRLPNYRLLEERVERLRSGPVRGAVSLPIATGL